MHSYHLEFILEGYNVASEVIKSSLAEFAGAIEISTLPQDNPGKVGNFKIHLNTEDPTVIFDICAQLGRIKSVKIDEEGGR
jgi:dihydroxyacetone kinase-like predicted kinase